MMMQAANAFFGAFLRMFCYRLMLLLAACYLMPVAMAEQHKNLCSLTEN